MACWRTVTKASPPGPRRRRREPLGAAIRRLPETHRPLDGDRHADIRTGMHKWLQNYTIPPDFRNKVTLDYAL